MGRGAGSVGTHCSFYNQSNIRLDLMGRCSASAKTGRRPSIRWSTGRVLTASRCASVTYDNKNFNIIAYYVDGSEAYREVYPPNPGEP